VTCNKSLKEYGQGREKYCPRFSLRNLPLFKDSHIFKRQKQFGSFSIVEFRFEVLGSRKYYYPRMRALYPLYPAFIFLNKIMCEGKEICKPIHHSWWSLPSGKTDCSSKEIECSTNGIKTKLVILYTFEYLLQPSLSILLFLLSIERKTNNQTMTLLHQNIEWILPI